MTKVMYGPSVDIAIDMLLAGSNPELVALREQLRQSRVTPGEFTGSGFFIDFAVMPSAPRIAKRKRIVIGDVDGEFEGSQAGGFLLFIDDGALSMLECFLYEPVPTMPRLLRAFYTRRCGMKLVETSERDIVAIDSLFV